ncbi:hypothetical protein CYLTODRAFT_199108 [Cylindrobasidium torrendii FP15055 ss-10]|uniref:Uncharacterized protein n=1 Tax=Cylindrobasidium torrendii FP15055 ss-10 TaxID=1314674 RepID=A0A0D7AXI0_9AGAR|nr:hypothetical protein CYLTODRAFT_199108 [Cylindrobasidium torrendii FP15055 ss-10]
MRRMIQQEEVAGANSDATQSLNSIPRSLRDLERQITICDSNSVVVDSAKGRKNILSSLQWLFDTTSHRSVKHIIHQSLGALPFTLSEKERTDIKQRFFDDKDYQPTAEDIKIHLTQAEIDVNLRMLRTYAMMKTGATASSRDKFETDRVDDAILCLVANVRVRMQEQRVELRGCLKQAFRDAAGPLSLPIRAWQQLCVAGNLDNGVSTFLQGTNAALQLYSDVYNQVKDSLDTSGAWEVISDTLLDPKSTAVSPLTAIPLKDFLARAGVLFDLLHSGTEQRWIYTDDDDNQLRPRIRFLLDMNQFFVITLNTDSTSKLDGGHLEGLWKIIKAFVNGGTSYVEDSAVCVAIHKTLESVIDTQGPHEGLLPYPSFTGALNEMLATYDHIADYYTRPVTPPTSLLLRIAARRDRFDEIVRFAISGDVPEAYELFISASPEATTSRQEGDIRFFVDAFAQGVARSTSSSAAKIWKDEAARKRCADWFLDEERFPWLVQQAGYYNATTWDATVLSQWRPQLGAWYHEELDRVVSEFWRPRRNTEVSNTFGMIDGRLGIYGGFQRLFLGTILLKLHV